MVVAMVVGLVVAAPLLAAVGAALLLLSADCTDAALAEHGAPGCERSEEQWPGISVRE